MFNLERNTELRELLLNNKNVEWLGNEVSCGVGMQRIDVLSIHQEENEKIITPIELKATKARKGITRQLKRYVDWLELYFIPNIKVQAKIQPVIIAEKYKRSTPEYKKLTKISDKECAKPRDTVREFFKRFCPDLQKHVIRFDRGGFDVHLFNVISPYSFQDKMSETLVFHDSNGYSRKYTCKFDEKGNFIGWQNA